MDTLDHCNGREVSGKVLNEIFVGGQEKERDL